MHAAILGTGLIGASLGMGLRAEAWSTTGFDPDPATLEKAAERGAVTVAHSVEGAVEGADLVILAGPPTANIDLVTTVVTTGLVTDVTGVKRAVMRAAPHGLRFVGGHPMAGREHAGPQAASPALFRGAPWIICEDGASADDLEFMETTVTALGAHPVRMSAASHDEVVARISHLPHLLAGLLTTMASGRPESGRLVSGSFRDLTRVAGGDAGWWPDVLTANADEVISAIKGLIAELESVEKMLGEGNLDGLGTMLTTAREIRARMTPGLARVHAVLQDRPGELAAVGRAFAASRVDIRDLQLRHAEHGGGGVLTITVRLGEDELLRAALNGEGFEVE